jgi:GT2 family glycosyltransferase
LQLIVTDNLGDDLPALDPTPWHSLVLLRNQRSQGFASNHNAAFKLAQGEYFCILNPDVLFLEPVFERLIEHIATRSADITAPLVIDPQGLIQDSFRSLPTPSELFRRRALGQTPAPKISTEDLISPDWIAGFFLLMPAPVYAGLGGMDERYRLYLEDVDFCTRARLNGLSLLVDPRIHLQHDARRASRQDLRYLLWHARSALRFFISPVYRQARKAG